MNAEDYKNPPPDIGYMEAKLDALLTADNHSRSLRVNARVNQYLMR
jgi:hypothetical protein